MYGYEDHPQQGGGGGGGGGSGPPGVFPPPRLVFDGKRMRKPIQRKTVDFNGTMIKYVEDRRAYQHGDSALCSAAPTLQPNSDYVKDMLPTQVLSPVNSVAAKFVHTSTNKIRCPINCIAWTPEGRRLITGSSSGEFTLWNGLTFNFETILQAHDTAVRAMVWTHNDNWMVTGDHGGYIKYWQSNMNNVKAFQAHKEAVRDISFCPTDVKFASCSDDVTLKIWDFAHCKEEHVLTGHGWDVKTVDWHPQKSIVVSGSKDNLIKIWDAKSGKNINTLHGHKNTVLQVKWNRNGNWLLTASRDQLVKLFDIRMMKEMQTFRAHKKEVTAISWHPFHEDFFVSGGFDGSLLFWLVGTNEVQSEITAHESSIWDLAWHPVGHILCSGSNDHTTKFWCRNRPGETIHDKVSGSKASVDNMEEKMEIVSKIDVQPNVPPGIVSSGFGAPRIPPTIDPRNQPMAPRSTVPPTKQSMPVPPFGMPPFPPHMIPPPGFIPPPGMPPPGFPFPPPGMPLPPNFRPPFPLPPPGMPFPVPPPGMPLPPNFRPPMHPHPSQQPPNTQRQ